MVVESIDLLKAAVIFWLIGTVVAVFAGFVEVTVGDVVSGVEPVVKVHGFGAEPPFATALPPGSLAPVVMEAVNAVFAARLAVGAKVAVLFVASYVTPPATADPPLVTRKVAGVIVARSIGLLKVAVIFLLIGTAMTLFTGFVELTVGGSKLTVNACAPLAMAKPVTVMFCGPVGALAAMANIAVICVLRTTVTLLTVIPVPLMLIVAPGPKFVPVSVTATVCPCVPLFGLTELSVGVSVGARVATPLHPATKMPSRNAILRPRGHTLLAMYVRICVPSLFSDMVPPSMRSGRRADSVAF